MIYFVAPDFDSFISGGNIFNKQIYRALQELGMSLKQVEYPFSDMQCATHNDLLLIDSIYINDLKLKQLATQTCKKYFICHLLPSMIAHGKGMKYEKNVLQLFDKIIVNSIFCRDYIIKLKLSSNVEVIQPFIDVPMNMVLDKKRSGAIIIANWLPSKQLHIFLKLLSRKEPLPLPVSIIGSTKMNPDYFKFCKKIISNSEGLKEKVKVFGELGRMETWLALFKSKLLLDCSSFETYGMAVAEAVSIGLPVLSLGNGNIKNLVPPESICDSMDMLVDRLINAKWSKPRTDSIKNIITGWDTFIHQFKNF